jgi:lysophospholipase L1-like esterase
MSASDRSWTIARALLWFVGLLVAALVVLDGGLGKIADRFRARRDPAAVAAAGSPLGMQPAVVAEGEAPEAAGDTGAPPGPIVAADRSKILALEDTCIDGTPAQCKRWAMDGFYGAIESLKQGKLSRAVRVSWYGDSVIATDAIPGRLRSRLQDELGNGGPGFVFVVPPHRFCGHEAITRSSGGTWNAHAISTSQIADGLYGVGGSTAETDDGRATIKLVAGAVSQVELYYLAQPRGGSVTVTADGKQVARADTRNASKQPGYAAATLDGGGAAKFDIATSGKVRLFGIDLENPRGVVVDNFGVVSVNVKSFDAQKPEHFQAELAHRAADLVMIMIGANEAEWLGPTDRDTRDYGAHYGKLLAEIRGARPDASCLVVSPTDQAVAVDGSYASRPVMPKLVAAQREAAQTAGCAFYSTYDWMGGNGSAAKWFRKGMVGTDFQHLSRKGAERLADGLFGTLMAGYQKYAAH